jgi:hypothetical protein
MSLFSGVREDVCRVLQLASLDHKKDLLRHVRIPLDAEAGRRATERVFEKVKSNVQQLVANREAERAAGRTPRSPSAMNWRMDHPVTKCDDKNKLREVGLERAVVAAFREAGNKDWWNQVPVASGLYGKSAGKRRAIDLVQRRTASSYDLIELKVDSNRPLFAAIEILEYGFAWYFSRLESGIGYDAKMVQRSLLSADRVHLSVLAPTAFYCDADYQVFGQGIESALAAMDGKVRMSFDGFKRLPFAWNADVTPAQLRAEMTRLYPPAT